jgi:hypothetical protein
MSPFFVSALLVWLARGLRFGRSNQGRITAMRKVTLSLGIVGTGIILGTVVWLCATPARLGAG